jgi:hypothetical protein
MSDDGHVRSKHVVQLTLNDQQNLIMINGSLTLI